MQTGAGAGAENTAINRFPIQPFPSVLSATVTAGDACTSGQRSLSEVSGHISLELNGVGLQSEGQVVHGPWLSQDFAAVQAWLKVARQAGQSSGSDRLEMMQIAMASNRTSSVLASREVYGSDSGKHAGPTSTRIPGIVGSPAQQYITD